MAAILGFFLRPLCISIDSTIKIPIIQKPICSSSFSSFSSLAFPHIPSLSIVYSSYSNPNDCYSLALLDKELEQDEDQEFESEEHDSNDEEDDVGIKNGEEGSPINLGLKVVPGKTEAKNVKLPNLTVKKKKELASYAHGLGKKLKYQLVGKSGVTDNVISSFLETLEANEFLKINIHRTCPGELEVVVSQLEQAIGPVVVGQIGRTVILYKPSLTKMRAEERKKRVSQSFYGKANKVETCIDDEERAFT